MKTERHTVWVAKSGKILLRQIGDRKLEVPGLTWENEEDIRELIEALQSALAVSKRLEAEGGPPDEPRDQDPD